MAHNHWPLPARLIAVFGSFVLVAGVVINVHLLVTFRDQIGFGAWGYWSDADDCYIISPTTAISWPALTEGVLRPSDCIDTLDGVVLTNHKRNTNLFLTYFLTEVPEGQMLTLTGQRNGRPLSAEVATLRLTLERILEGSLALVIPGLGLWFLGWPVLLAQPDSEGNRALAWLLFIGALLFMTNMTGLYYGWEFRMYSWLFVWAARPFLGALLFHLAFLFPEPPVKSPLRFWRFAMYPVAAVACMLSAGAFLGAEPLGILLRPVYIGNNAFISIIFIIGSCAFFGRSLAIWRHPTSSRRSHQAVLLMLALLGILPVVAFDMLLYNLRLPWLFINASNDTVAYWIIPAAALLAYAMLRYQTFAYRGLALNALMVVVVSAALTQIYSVFLAPRGWDGVQFATVWGAILLATLFWFVDSPIRRAFRRLFVRHEFDFQVAQHFSQQMAAATGVDDALTRAARFLCDNLELAWVALSSIHRSRQLWLATADQHAPPPLHLTSESPESRLPGTPVKILPISNGVQPLGTVWLGPRTTAEPVDEKDYQLVTMLGQELARTLAVHAQIEDLEQVPGRILTAVEADRYRIGQDLHDSVLQFLGAIPLELDRASQLVDRDPAQAQAILERTIDEAGIVSQETRASVYDLSPPILLRQGVIEAARVFAEQSCIRHSVGLVWKVGTGAGLAWQSLPDTQAIQVYRIVQQAADNALAHAQPATLTVRFDQTGGEFIVQVIDDGDGFMPAPTLSPSGTQASTSGLGLISMQARAKALAGTLTVVSAPGHGTTVTLRFACA